MGRRKSSRAKLVPQKRPEKLDVDFDCPFCGHPKSVDCEVDKKKNVGKVSCRICEVGYLVALTPLTEPIDMYAEWIDECEQINAVLEDEVEHHDDRIKRMRVDV